MKGEINIGHDYGVPGAVVPLAPASWLSTVEGPTSTLYVYGRAGSSSHGRLWRLSSPVLRACWSMPFQRAPDVAVPGPGLPLPAASLRSSDSQWRCTWGCEHAGICSICLANTERNDTISRFNPGICVHGLCQRQCVHEAGHGQEDGATSLDVPGHHIIHHCERHMPTYCSSCRPGATKRKDGTSDRDDDQKTTKRSRPNKAERQRNWQAGLRGSGEARYQ